MADITNKNCRVPGVNQDTNFMKQRSYCFDGGVVPEIMSIGTHNIIAVPVGECVAKIRVIALENSTSGGSATLQFKLSFGETSEVINSSTIAVGALAAGDVHELVVNGIKAYDAEKTPVIQLVVGSSAFTAMKLLVIVETLPVTEFMTMG